jgi:hypothetical protein
MPVDWKEVVTVDISRITLKRLITIEKNNQLKISLNPDEAVSIIPHIK